MSGVTAESRCVCWTGIFCFVILSIGLFYYFFISTPTVPKIIFDPIPTRPVPGIPDVAKLKQAEEHAKTLVEKINNHPQRTWIAEINPSAVGLTTLDQSAFVISNDSVDEEILKALQEMNDILKGDLFLDYYDKHVRKLKEDIYFVPEYFDAAERWPMCEDTINEIHDQGGCGSCWAIAAATLITDRICISNNGNYKKKISAQDLLECCYFCGSCNGTLDPFTPFIYWHEHGIHTNDCYPYTIEKNCGSPCLPDTFINPIGLGECKGRKLCRKPGEQAKYVYKIGSIHDNVSSQRTMVDAWFDRFGENVSTVELVKREIMKHGPVVLCFNVFEGFMHYKKGVYNMLTGADGHHIYDHCVKITGWGTDDSTGSQYLKAINSWSKNWATDGTFLISISVLQQTRSDFYAGIPRL